jgi:tape measure domain-containing protein
MATREDVVIHFGGNAKGVDATLGKIRNGVSGLGSQLGALGLGLSFAAVTREMVTQAIALENLGKAFAQVTGSAAGSAEAMAYVREVSERLGLEVISTADAYLSLSAAAKGTSLEGVEAKRIFEAVAGAMAKLGKSADQTKGALTAIEQMISKGKVSAEELNQQLGERLPAAFPIAARAMGKTTEEMNKLMSTGKVLAVDLLPKLARELEKLYDTNNRVDGTVASWNRLKNTFGEVSEKAGTF